MRIIHIAQPSRMYPRYIAEKHEGRLKGQYPSPEFKMVPSLRRQWDNGGFGSGTKRIEIESDSAAELLDKLRGRGYSATHDNFDFYEIRSPGSPRTRVSIQTLLDLSRGNHPE